MSQLELAGIPTVVLGTTAFVAAAEEQYAALGFARGSFHAVAHPLGSMPLERVLAEAEQAVEPVLHGLLRGAGVAPIAETAHGPAGAALRPAKPTPPAAATVAARACSHAPDEDT